MARRHAVCRRHRKPSAAKSRSDKSCVVTIAGTGEQCGRSSHDRYCLSISSDRRFQRHSTVRGLSVSTATTFTLQWPEHIKFGECRSTNRELIPMRATAEKTSLMDRCCANDRTANRASVVCSAQRSGTDGKWLTSPTAKEVLCAPVPLDPTEDVTHHLGTVSLIPARAPVHLRRRGRTARHGAFPTLPGRRLLRRPPVRGRHLQP